jgi:hypothetical protein
MHIYLIFLKLAIQQLINNLGTFKTRQPFITCHVTRPLPVYYIDHLSAHFVDFSQYIIIYETISSVFAYGLHSNLAKLLSFTV